MKSGAAILSGAFTFETQLSSIGDGNRLGVSGRMGEIGGIPNARPYSVISIINSPIMPIYGNEIIDSQVSYIGDYDARISIIADTVTIGEVG